MDPGTRKVGISILEHLDNRINYVESWQLPLKGILMSERLYYLGEELDRIIKIYPDLHSIAVEETFISPDIVKNKEGDNKFRYSKESPLALSMCRGVVHYIGGRNNLPVYEYPTTQVKKALTGNSNAGKVMVTRAAEKRFSKSFKEDEADSIGVGMAHILTLICNAKK